mgnify:CR=1 FL=1
MIRHLDADDVGLARGHHSLDSLDMAQRREARTVREAEARALEGVAQAQPKKKKSTGAKRSRVTKSAQGIKVSMPSKKKK